ncbi:uncharacterized protein LOC116193883 [Punica granatum]|uniref:Uncharacterized protein LOC116193883 n=1 Tax=Punica granatum TaxID=22663 RepID=A0A6P8C7Q2_PUNGR|nr:uncharacterized protein LOC116193883 [Punica granatum]
MEAGLSSFSALAPPVWGDLSSFGSENASLSRGCDYLEAARNNISRIMACESAKAIWDFLKAEYQGDERIKSIKVPNLIREFKRLQMDESETIMEYSDKLIGIAKKVRFAKLVSALQAPECGRSMRLEGSVEGALKAKLQQHSGGKEKKWKGRKGMAVAHRQLQEKVVQATMEGEKGDRQQGEAHAAVQQEVNQPSIASCFTFSTPCDSWLVDSGCTNHMTSDEKLFRNLDKSMKLKVRIENWEYLAVEGKESIAIESCVGTKLVFDVMYVSEIDQNLLSVGQLLEKGFKLIFEGRKCLIFDSSDKELFKIKM